MDQEGEILLHKDLPADPEVFLKTIDPFREDLVVAVECIFTWYWLADLCALEKIPFVLGHALYMKAIHGAKVKSDKIDSRKIAQLLRSGLIPQAYVYPRQMRATRDLLRRRCYLVRQSSSLLAHVQNSTSHGHLVARQNRPRSHCKSRLKPLVQRILQATVDLDAGGPAESSCLGCLVIVLHGSSLRCVPASESRV